MATTAQDHSATTASPLDSHTAPTTSTSQRSSKAMGSFITGIIGFLAFLIPIAGLILGIVAVSLGASARGEIKRNGKTNGWMATAGLVLGTLAILASLALWIAAVASA